jgi:hypothetical protein
MANQNTHPDTKGDTEEVALPTTEEIDTIFAYIMSNAEESFSGPIADALLTMTSTHWQGARDVVAEGEVDLSSREVEEIKEEWL